MNVTIKHTYREANQLADKIANLALQDWGAIYKLDPL